MVFALKSHHLIIIYRVKWENLLRILAMAGTSPSYIVRWFPSGAHFVRGFPGHVWSRWSFRIGLCQSTSALVSPLLHFVRSKLVQGSGCWGVTWYPSSHGFVQKCFSPQTQSFITTFSMNIVFFPIFWIKPYFSAQLTRAKFMLFFTWSSLGLHLARVEVPTLGNFEHSTVHI